MKKIFCASIIICLSLVFISAKALAYNNNQAQNQVQNQTQNQAQNQVQNRNQESNGQGEMVQQQQESQIQTQYKLKNEGLEQQIQTTQETVNQLQNMQGESLKNGNGEQIQQIIQEQTQSQERVQEQVYKLESRNGFVRWLIGPNYGAINEIEKEMEQNRERIMLLEQLEIQIQNTADQTQIQAVIQALTEQNTALQDQINNAKRFSLFGWLFRLFS